MDPPKATVWTTDPVTHPPQTLELRGRPPTHYAPNQAGIHRHPGLCINMWVPFRPSLSLRSGTPVPLAQVK